MSENFKPRTVKRQPPEESFDIYPGLCVHDDRVSGSITAARSRLPLRAFVEIALYYGWDEVVGEDSSYPHLEKDYD